MSRKGILINYDYCTGCHSCEVACRTEHNYKDNEGGIIVSQIGPWEYAEDKYQYSFVPAITDQCDQCAKRVDAGKLPTCVHHCQAYVMEYGDVVELAGKAVENSKSLLYIL
ncbi:oxidoreductase [Actinomycetota bacterium]|nr:oxidoreductase [Actinomycetota bacterium]